MDPIDSAPLRRRPTELSREQTTQQKQKQKQIIPPIAAARLRYSGDAQVRVRFSSCLSLQLYTCSHRIYMLAPLFLTGLRMRIHALRGAPPAAARCHRALTLRCPAMTSLATTAPGSLPSFGTR